MHFVQVNADIGIDTKHQTLQGVAFPITQAAIEKLQELQNRAISYVQLVCSEIDPVKATDSTP